MKHKFLRVLSIGTILGVSFLGLTSCSKKPADTGDIPSIVTPDKINIAVEVIVNDTTTDIVIESDAKDKELTVSYIDKDGETHSNELIFTNGKTTVLFPRLQEDYTIHDFSILKGDEKLYYRANLTIYKFETVTPEPSPDEPEVKKYNVAILTNELTNATINFLENDKVVSPSKIVMIENGSELLNDKSVKYYTFEDNLFTINKLAFGFGTHKITVYYTIDKTTSFFELEFTTKSDDFYSDLSLTSSSKPLKGVKQVDLIFSIKLKENVHLKSLYINDSLYELVEGSLDSRTGLTKYYIKANSNSLENIEIFTLKNIRFEYEGYYFDDARESVTYTMNYSEAKLNAGLKYEKTDYFDDETKKATLSVENIDGVTLDSILINSTWYSFEDIEKKNGNIETNIEINPNADGKDVIKTIKYKIENTELEYELNKESTYKIMKKYKVEKVNEGRYKNGSYYYSNTEGTRFHIEFDETLDSNISFEFSGTYGDSTTFRNGVNTEITEDTIFECGIEDNKIYFDFSPAEPTDLGEYLSLRFNKFNMIRTDKNASYSILDDLNHGYVSNKKAGFFEGISYVRNDTNRNVLFFRTDTGYDLDKLVLNKLTVELYDENKNLINIPNDELNVGKYDDLDSYIFGIPERTRYIKVLAASYTYDDEYYQTVYKNPKLIEIIVLTNEEA